MSYDQAVLEEASRLWTETGMTAPEIAERVGITFRSFGAMRFKHRKHFPPRDYRQGDPTPEEIEAGIAEIQARREKVRAEGRTVRGDPDEPGRVEVRSYSFDRTTFAYSQHGTW